MTCFIGIDPGTKGGIALVRSFDPKTIDMVNHAATPMPLLGEFIDCSRIYQWCVSMMFSPVENAHFIIEQVGAMPEQGLSSTFKFGRGYGQLIGMCQALGWPYTLVTPQKWKGVVLAGTPKDKAAAIAFAAREYPSIPLVQPRCRVPHDGVADAICLAHYGKVTHAPTNG